MITPSTCSSNKCAFSILTAGLLTVDENCWILLKLSAFFVRRVHWRSLVSWMIMFKCKHSLDGMDEDQTAGHTNPGCWLADSSSSSNSNEVKEQTYLTYDFNFKKKKKYFIGSMQSQPQRVFFIRVQMKSTCLVVSHDDEESR